MRGLSLEQRVAALEQQVEQLKNQKVNGRDGKPWLRVQGIFAGDTAMKEIFDDALELREKHRERTRRRHTKKAATRQVEK